MSATPKLTKKQKKGLAFRERKTGKTKDKDDRPQLEDNDIPVLEDQDTLGAEGVDVQVETVVERKKKKLHAEIEGGSAKTKGKRKAEEEPEMSKKRKRDGDVDGDNVKEEKQHVKRKKTVDAVAETKVTKIPAANSKQRFILFVGNLKYTTSLEAIKAHFAACDPPPTVRLLTPKPAAPGKPVNKSKGCAFLEFTHRNALQQALKLHQSDLEGRMINVELTAGGGGKSETRLTKVKERNKGLLGQRKERIEKATPDGSIPTLPDRPQRYSATSGIDQVPLARRTWTIGDVDDGETHRGGTRHTKGSKTRSGGRAWGTGVNAIPVG
ncbi:hypothetical protein Hypma_015744 [Hypsizygus marmoreus]|uniref:RRM domain-containing protein n=1 Tax=Hypsizygus marmoreus TaxID=39966 RepID=A0A369KAF5_HYPMA|nr:hypothetical protein Hypma_015744 [Hypsizygus marmoreus]